MERLETFRPRQDGGGFGRRECEASSPSETRRGETREGVLPTTGRLRDVCGGGGMDNIGRVSFVIIW